MRAWISWSLLALVGAAACGEGSDGPSNPGAGGDATSGSAGEGGSAGNGGSANTSAGNGTGGSEGGEAGSTSGIGGAAGSDSLPLGGAGAGAGAGGQGGDGPIDTRVPPDPRCEDANDTALLGEGSAEDPYLVCSVAQLKLLDTDTYPLSKSYALGRDLAGSGDAAPKLGGTIHVLSGSLDGRGHWIEGTAGTLLIGIAAGAVVRDLRIVGGSDSKAALLSVNNSGLVQDVHGSGTRILLDHSGLLVGNNAATGTIERSSTSGAAISTTNHVGGLVGENNGVIRHCWSSASVTANSRVGGLVGNLSATGQVIESYATGAVSGQFSVGGLVGTQFGGSIVDSYARSGLVTGPKAAGLVGQVEGTGSIIRSYATSPVSGTGAMGLVGGAGAGLTVTSSYFADTATGTVGTALSPDELKDQASFEGWDFDAVWMMNSKFGEYPSLRFQAE